MITDLVAALSGALEGILSDEGQPPLKAGEILLGRQRVAENAAPPQVIMIPMRSVWGPKDTYPGAKVVGNPHADERAEALARSLLTDQQFFEVRTWGAATAEARAANKNADFDATEQLYKLFLRALHHCAPNAYALEDGEWIDQQPDAVQLVKLGHVFVFTIGLPTPVLDDAFAFVPPGTRPNTTPTYEPPEGGSPEAP